MACLVAWAKAAVSRKAPNGGMRLIDALPRPAYAFLMLSANAPCDSMLMRLAHGRLPPYILGLRQSFMGGATEPWHSFDQTFGMGASTTLIE